MKNYYKYKTMSFLQAVSYRYIGQKKIEKVQFY